MKKMEPIGILIISETNYLFDYLRNISIDKKAKISCVKNRQDALEFLKKEPYEIIITDSKNSSTSDYEVIKNIKDIHTNSCIIVNSAYSSINEVLETLKAGAYDFIPKPFDEETLKIIINKATERQELYKEREIFKNLAVIDELTEVYNRRFFQDMLANELSRSDRFSHPLSLLMIDLDNFKHYNDTYGHVVGDKILRTFAGLMLKNVRTIDYVCRLGGDEFTIILPETSKEGAYNLARRLKNAMPKMVIPDIKEPEHNITISIGIANFPTDSTDVDQLLAKSDQALYDAKKFGKNQICLFSSDGQSTMTKK